MSASPNPAASSIKLNDLRALARTLLQKQPDPHLAAAQMVKKLSDADLRAIAVELLAQWLRSNPGQDLRRANLRPSPSKWEGHHRTAEGYKTVPIYIGEEWKQFGDLTADDLEQLAVEQEQRASALLNSAKGYRRLAEEMRRRKVSKVKQLDESTVREAMQ